VSDPHYGYHIFWYPEDESWVARCIELPSISGVGDSPGYALAEAETAVDLAVSSLVELGEPLPPVKPVEEPKRPSGEYYG
jgi:predicted RNase H-like HicB family nuclease